MRKILARSFGMNAKLPTKMTPLEITIHGQRLKWLLDLNAPSQHFIFAHCQDGMLYEAPSVLALDKHLNPGETFINVGAHIGFFTIIGAAMVGPSGRVIAFEPNVENFGALQRNVDLNGLKNVVLLNQAVGENEGRAKMYQNLDNDGGHALWPPGLHPGNPQSKIANPSFEVNQVTIDGTMERLGLQNIGSMKIDTEGAEVKVLRGANQCLKSAGLKFVICEHLRFGLEAMGTKTSDILRIFYSCGFRGYLSPDGAKFEEVTFGSDFEPRGEWFENHSKFVSQNFFFKRDPSPSSC